MILHTTEVMPLSDYRLFLRFNNGDAGEIDLSGELDGEVFEPLRDQAQFATAYQHTVMRTVAWANGAGCWGMPLVTPCPINFGDGVIISTN